MRTRIASILSLFLGVGVSGVQGEELTLAVAAGKVTVRFQGTGSSSGDSIEVVIARTSNAGPKRLRLTIAPGTRLGSGAASDQGMVIAGISGRVVDANSYEPTAVIEAADGPPAKYILEAYCTEFEKNNPSPDTLFTLDTVDPVLACILGSSSTLSTEARQAAVWIQTDKVTYGHLNEKLSVSASDWSAAQGVVRRCQSSSAP